jgi:dTDP-4-dehydrorhamnose reductase
MERLLRERPEVRVVADQIGIPTWSRFIAQATQHVLLRHGGQAQGIYNLTGTGQCSWFDFATEIGRLLTADGANVGKVLPITTAEYPTPARRPANSVLDSGKLQRDFGLTLPDWRQALALSMAR